MSYQQGEAQRTEGWRDGKKYISGEIELPHSCDEWVIGSPDEARLLIQDLNDLIAEIESEGKVDHE